MSLCRYLDSINHSWRQNGSTDTDLAKDRPVWRREELDAFARKDNVLDRLQSVTSLGSKYLVGLQPGFLTTQEDVATAKEAIFAEIALLPTQLHRAALASNLLGDFLTKYKNNMLERYQLQEQFYEFCNDAKGDEMDVITTLKNWSSSRGEGIQPKDKTLLKNILNKSFAKDGPSQKKKGRSKGPWFKIWLQQQNHDGTPRTEKQYDDMTPQDKASERKKIQTCYPEVKPEVTPKFGKRKRKQESGKGRKRQAVRRYTDDINAPASTWGESRDEASDEDLDLDETDSE